MIEDQKQEIRINVQQVALVVGILIGVAGFIGAWAIIPYRITAAEHEIEVLKVKSATDHESIVQIKENVLEIRRILETKRP